MKENFWSKLKNKRIYSIEGNIGAGKSTLINKIGLSIKDVEFIKEPVGVWENLGGENLLKKFYEDPIRWGYSFEAYVMQSKVEALMKGAKTEKPIIMVERSILSNKVFFELSAELGKLDLMEHHMLLNIFEFYTNFLYPKLSGIVYLETPLEECIRRIKKRNRCGEEEVDRNYLGLVEDKFNQFINNTDIPILRIDGFYDYDNALNQINAFLHKQEI